MLRFIVVRLQASSGTRGAFEELLKLEDKCKYAQEIDSTGAVMAKVAATPGAIGYVSLDVIDDTVHTLKIDGVEPTEENKNNPDIFNNNEEAIGFATKDLNLEITRLEEGEEIPGPVINAEDKIVNLGDEFNPLDGVTAIDALGNDITEKIEVVENTVDTSKEGEYKFILS